MLALRHGGEEKERQGEVRRRCCGRTAREGGREGCGGGGVKNVISLTLWGGRGESGASPPRLTLLLLLQLERDFKVLMPVEKRNTARRFASREG